MTYVGLDVSLNSLRYAGGFYMADLLTAITIAGPRWRCRPSNAQDKLQLLRSL
ncbi:hypothetical protein [Bradyrhizobium sp. NAS96.2]|uniref:hypothetical protein n=1 Tax=Bradyrhizobium sp. NAS96.2 TaxID=1680160 RepID=UPI00143D985D|nr:hypothetical protein [Bradyrhizobium sp. NAS96.2]